MNRLLAALVAKVPVWLASASALAYFALSEGIRQHARLLWRAAQSILAHLR